MKRILTIALTMLAICAHAGTPLYSTITAQGIKAGTPGTEFHVGILTGGKIQYFTITFYVTADPTPTPKPTVKPTPGATP